jgi:hypothetical protein
MAGLEAATADSLANALSCRRAFQSSLDYGSQQSQMDNVFVPKHKLGALIDSCGNEGATMDQIIESVQGAADGIYGKANPLVRVINGFTVTIRGAMINGVFKIGTAFIP